VAQHGDCWQGIARRGDLAGVHGGRGQVDFFQLIRA
jgi:hypothetical protein